MTPSFSPVARRFLQILACLVLVGCQHLDVKPLSELEAGPTLDRPDEPAAKKALMKAVPPVQLDGRTIRPGNELVLRSRADERLNVKARVGFDGSVTLPYQVTKKVAGMTVAQLKAELDREYAHLFLNARPDYSLGLAPTRKVLLAVRGSVQKPGMVTVDPAQSLEEVITAAGGLARASERHEVTLIRSGKNSSLDLNEAMRAPTPVGQTLWEGGESLVVVPRSASLERIEPGVGPGVSFYGEVVQPGTYALQEGGDFFHHLDLARGLTGNADLKQMYLVRQGKQYLYAFSLDAPEKMPQLQSGDVVMFKSREETLTEYALRIATSIATIVTSVALVVIAL